MTQSLKTLSLETLLLKTQSLGRKDPFDLTGLEIGCGINEGGIDAVVDLKKRRRDGDSTSFGTAPRTPDGAALDLRGKLRILGKLLYQGRPHPTPISGNVSPTLRPELSREPHIR